MQTLIKRKRNGSINIKADSEQRNYQEQIRTLHNDKM